MVRLAARDGVITEAEARPIRQAALEAKAQMNDVLQSVGRVG
jgi:plasmid stability protein